MNRARAKSNDKEERAEKEEEVAEEKEGGVCLLAFKLKNHNINVKNKP